jgi:hypothetical protein
MKQRKPSATPECSICHSQSAQLMEYLGGHVCETCSEKTRLGVDTTSHALRLQQAANTAQVQQLTGEETSLTSDELEYKAVSNALMAQEILDEEGHGVRLGSGGEVINPKVAGLVNTMNEPGIAAIEASNHRTDLLTSLGNDIAAMALDASDTISAGNSLEKMFAHQMAALHEAGMQMFRRANLMEDHAAAAKAMGVAIKACTAYQGAMVTLDKMRSDKRQHIVVQHVNVNAGGQAVVGSVSTRGGRTA